MGFVDITLGRAQRPVHLTPQAMPQPQEGEAPAKLPTPTHLTGSTYEAFKQAVEDGTVTPHKGLAAAYRRFLRKRGQVDPDGLSLLPAETDDDVFTAVHDTMDTWPQESGFFVFQQLLNDGTAPMPWGETTPAPLSNATSTRAWLMHQEDTIETTLRGIDDTTARLWMVSRQREFREIRERLEDLLADPHRD